MISANRETSSPLSLWAKRWTLALAATGVGLMVSGCKTEYNTASTFNNTVTAVNDAANPVQISGVAVKAGSTVKFATFTTFQINGRNLDRIAIPTSENCLGLEVDVAQSDVSKIEFLCAPVRTSVDIVVTDLSGKQLGSYTFAIPKPQVTITTTEGDILLELAADVVPETVLNFLFYIGDMYYDGTIFHRVVNDPGVVDAMDPTKNTPPMRIIQGGGYTGISGTSLVPREGSVYDPITLESNKGLSNVAGTVAMARTPDFNSATSEFYINVQDNTFLDYQSDLNPGYAVFGRVISGLDVAARINLVPTQTLGGVANIPVTDVKILTARQTR
jgi:cyclophilin family peptidyl-prolyl cis-trans isomerase